MPTLTDLYNAQKADKYTQDGRETLDKVYHNGEISQVTGLQKQPDGSWAPPKSTKYGKVTTNKEGKVGIQQTLGKGSKFEEFANEKAASRALANLTAGYNTTERSKEDPHSDKARLLKHWAKETEQIRKENKAERRAEHAAQFQKESAGTEKDGFKAHHEAIESVENGNLDEKIVNTAGDIEEMRDIARDVLDATDYDDPEEFAKDVESITSSMERRYQRLERRATAPAPQRKAQSSSSLKGYLENNFWSQPEDFENDIKEAGWDVEEMNGEYAVVSNEAGSQYEVRFSPHGDGHDLTMESFTPLMIDEDDEDDDIDDSAPRQLTGDTKIRVKK